MNLSLQHNSEFTGPQENIDIPKLKMYNWILRKIGSKKHYSDYVKLSMQQAEMYIDEEKPSLTEGVKKFYLRVGDLQKVFEEKADTQMIMEDMINSLAKHLECKHFLKILYFLLF